MKLYRLELIRYIHLNPVRAGMAKHAQGYPWTSHHAYLGQDQLPWLTTDDILGQFGGQVAKAREVYGRFIQDGFGEVYRKEFHCGGSDPRILGDDGFAAAVLAADDVPPRKIPLGQIEAKVLAAYDINRAALQSPSQQRHLTEARAALAWLARETGAGNLEQVARIVNRDAGSLSSAVRRCGDYLRGQDRMLDSQTNLMVLKRES